MAKPDYDAIAEVTGWNLANVESLNADLASQWAMRLPIVDQARSAIESAYLTTLRAVAKVPAVKTAAAALGPLTAAANAWQSVLAAMQEDMGETQKVNARRLFAARDLSILNTYTLGDWWTLAEISAPTDPTLIKPYAESLDDFEGQVTPRGFVFAAARGSGRRDVMRPSWPANPGSPAERAYAFGGEGSLVDTLPQLPGFQMEAGVINCVGEGETACNPDDFGALPPWLRKAAGWVCLPVDLSSGCSVPARAWWTYCLGAAPCWGWQGQRFPFSPVAQTLAAAIRSPSIWHLAIPESRVRASLKAVLMRSGILDLPEDPGQAADGIYRQKGGVRLILRGELAQGWSPSAKIGNPLSVRGQDLAEVVEAHLDWLALRFALLSTLPDQRPELRQAATASDEQQVRAALAGEPPADFSRDDPLRLVSEPSPKAPKGASKPKGAGESAKGAGAATDNAKAKAKETTKSPGEAALKSGLVKARQWKPSRASVAFGLTALALAAWAARRKRSAGGAT